MLSPWPTSRLAGKLEDDAYRAPFFSLRFSLVAAKSYWYSMEPNIMTHDKSMSGEVVARLSYSC